MSHPTDVADDADNTGVDPTPTPAKPDGGAELATQSEGDSRGGGDAGASVDDIGRGGD